MNEPHLYSTAWMNLTKEEALHNWIHSGWFQKTKLSKQTEIKVLMTLREWWLGDRKGLSGCWVLFFWSGICLHRHVHYFIINWGLHLWFMPFYKWVIVFQLKFKNFPWRSDDLSPCPGTASFRARCMTSGNRLNLSSLSSFIYKMG